MLVPAKSTLPCKASRLLRTVRRTPLVRFFNARGIGRNVDTYA